MTKRTLLAVLVLLVILGIVVAVQQLRNKKPEEQAAAKLSVAAFNQTKNQDAAAVAAQSDDIIVYTLTAQNQSDKVVSGHVLEVNIADISELATLIDAQGANYNSQTNSLVWTPLDIPQQGLLEKKFTVRVKEDLPEGSDLVMTVKFNNEIAVAVAKQQVAGIDSDKGTPPLASSYKSPTAGPSGWLAIFLAGLTSASIFILKARG